MDYSEANLYEDAKKNNKEQLEYDEQQYLKTDYDEELDGQVDQDEETAEQIAEYNQPPHGILRPSSAKNGNRMQAYQFIPEIIVDQISDPYKELRRIMLNIVMDRNLFNKDEIMNLASEAKRMNPKLQKGKIHQICKNIVFSLYGEA